MSRELCALRSVNAQSRRMNRKGVRRVAVAGFKCAMDSSRDRTAHNEECREEERKGERRCRTPAADNAERSGSDRVDPSKINNSG